MTIDEKRRRFRALHASGCFVLPNPWDVGGVRRLERLGFAALATTSAGAAWSLGVDDGEVALDAMLAHIHHLCEATDLPVNADFENGFADAPSDVAANVVHVLDAGVAGLSIEDRVRGEEALYPLALARERVSAARNAIERVAPDAMLVARCEAYLIGETNLDAVIARLRAYADAGADCVYAPGVLALPDVRRLVDALAPTPVNVLLNRPGITVAELAACGVRRVSVGSVLAREAWNAFDSTASALVEHGALPGR